MILPRGLKARIIDFSGLQHRAEREAEKEKGGEPHSKEEMLYLHDQAFHGGGSPYLFLYRWL